MSSRVLRKLGLQNEKELNCIGDEGSDTEVDFSSSSGIKKKKLNINRFDLVSGYNSFRFFELINDLNHHRWFTDNSPCFYITLLYM